LNPVNACFEYGFYLWVAKFINIQFISKVRKQAMWLYLKGYESSSPAKESS
jgi:hypothetical protein